MKAGARLGRGLVLVYHRISADGAVDSRPVVPTVSASLLKRHLDVLSELGDIVPLQAMMEPAVDRRRPRFAVTFDDDYVEHVRQACPVLRECGASATFFLSGRALHGLPAYWWEQLEWLIAERGVGSTAQTIGLPAGTAMQLAAACETDANARRRLAHAAPPNVVDPLDQDGMRALVETEGVTVGFHTLHHELLPGLADDALHVAVREGRPELEALVGAPLTLFAYPHGKAGQREAAAVRAAGYRGAWTGVPRPVRPQEDSFLLGRWECGPLDVDAFTTGVAVRLHRVHSQS